MTSLEDEKETVLRLRREGKPLQEISRQLGKSIYWVNSRLDPKYEPQRVRKTPKDETEKPPITRAKDPNLAKEVGLIVQLRGQGSSYEEIARKLKRSVYCGSGEAKFWMEPKVELAQNYGLNNRELRLARSLIEEHADEIRSAWHEHFGG